MFSVREKRQISDQIQQLLAATKHPELPKGEIEFHIHIMGTESSMMHPFVYRLHVFVLRCKYKDGFFIFCSFPTKRSL